MFLDGVLTRQLRGWMEARDAAEGGAGRVYVIGDVHGRLDRFAELISLIARDHGARAATPTRIVMLGDLIDRGPSSAQLVEFCLKQTMSKRFVVLKGNHEAMMVDALRGDLPTLDFWLEQGGRETLASWGVPRAALEEGANFRLLRQARRAVGNRTLRWMDGLPLTARHGSFLLVHAGIRPGVPLRRQTEEDLLWIREPFLQSGDDHGVVVVHGHTIFEDGPDIRRNRVGIDTGAWKTGRLTAMGIEGDRTWFLTTQADITDEASDRSPARALG